MAADGYGGVLGRVYPEYAAGGFTRVDGTVEFYQRVNALLTPDATVVNLGAGRGMVGDDTLAWRQGLADLRGRCERFVGLDVDPVVLENPHLDEAMVIGDDGRYPFEDSSVDLVLSDVMMPGRLDGIGLVNWLATHHPRLPVVLTQRRRLPHRVERALAVLESA